MGTGKLNAEGEGEVNTVMDWHPIHIRNTDTPSPGGGTPLYKQYRYEAPQRIRFLSHFDLKTDIQIWTIMVWNWVWVSKKPWKWHNMEIELGKKVRKRFAWKNVWYHILLNDVNFVVGKVSDHKWSTTFRRQVWKWVWVFEARSENGCGKWLVSVWNRVWIWRAGWPTPPRNLRGTPWDS